jgi:hypothetical protein
MDFVSLAQNLLAYDLVGYAEAFKNEDEEKSDLIAAFLSFSHPYLHRLLRWSLLRT